MSVPDSYLSVTAYLEGERDGSVRHEYVDGQVYAMAGSSDRHNRISINFTSRLDAHLTTSSCDVFMADMKIMVAPVVFYYPDVVVTCDNPIPDNYYRTEPRLIVEVLSPSTERIDRNEKLFAYRRVSSLEEYVLVSQDRTLVEIYRRQTNGEWSHEIFTNQDDEILLASVNLTMNLQDIYRNVRFPDGE